MAVPDFQLASQLTSTTFENFQKDDPPDPLYHYTNQVGLLGIIQSGELWATKVQYMNDSTEFGLAVELAKKRMEGRVLDSLVLEPTEPLPQIIEKLQHITQVNICSVSFCRQADLLSQWRGYSSGVGYAIGFSSLALVETARNQGCRLGRCIYDHSAQIGIVDELIDQITHQYAIHSGVVDSASLIPTLSEAFANAVIEFGAFFKDAAFLEEDEWRLVTNVKSYRDDNFGFRVGTSMPIPYYRLKVGNGSWRNNIGQVMIGPCPHPQLSEMAVKGLLVNQYVTTESWSTIPTPVHPPVNVSKIPYRSW
jgi:hypothetical protein